MISSRYSMRVLHGQCHRPTKTWHPMHPHADARMQRKGSFGWHSGSCTTIQPGRTGQGSRMVAAASGQHTRRHLRRALEHRDQQRLLSSIARLLAAPLSTESRAARQLSLGRLRNLGFCKSVYASARCCRSGEATAIACSAARLSLG